MAEASKEGRKQGVDMKPEDLKAEEELKAEGVTMVEKDTMAEGDTMVEEDTMAEEDAMIEENTTAEEDAEAVAQLNDKDGWQQEEEQNEEDDGLEEGEKNEEIRWLDDVEQSEDDSWLEEDDQNEEDSSEEEEEQSEEDSSEEEDEENDEDGDVQEEDNTDDDGSEDYHKELGLQRDAMDGIFWERPQTEAPMPEDFIGPQARFLKLVSGDGDEFIVEREHAMASKTIMNMISGPGKFEENEENKLKLDMIPSRVMQKVCDYLVYRSEWIKHKGLLREFPIEPEVSLELVMAGNFLEL